MGSRAESDYLKDWSQTKKTLIEAGSRTAVYEFGIALFSNSKEHGWLWPLNINCNYEPFRVITNKCGIFIFSICIEYVYVRWLEVKNLFFAPIWKKKLLYDMPVESTNPIPIMVLAFFNPGCLADVRIGFVDSTDLAK